MADHISQIAVGSDSVRSMMVDHPYSPSHAKPSLAGRGSFRDRMLALVDEHEQLEHQVRVLESQARRVRRPSIDSIDMTKPSDLLFVPSERAPDDWQTGEPSSGDSDRSPQESLCGGEGADHLALVRPSRIERMHAWERQISESHRQLLQATLKSDVGETIRILDNRADPNCEFTNFFMKKKEILTGGPLAIACLRGDADTMNALLEYQANPGARYTCAVGALLNETSFTVAHAAVARGSFEMLETLLENSADIHATTSLGGTLLWEASFTGNIDAAELLIRSGVSIDKCATSQDDLIQSYTPLHVACLQGHRCLVDVLLECKADVEGKNRESSTILEDAITAGHAGVVFKLVGSGANLLSLQMGRSSSYVGETCTFQHLSSTMTEQRCRRVSTTGGYRLIDHLFQSNDVVVAHAALGLQKVRNSDLDMLTIDDFVGFMTTPGDAPAFFLEAIMRPQEISYWDANNKRVHVSTGLVPMDCESNIAFGPHARKLVECFHHKQRPDLPSRDFIQDLVNPSNSGVNLRELRCRCCVTRLRFVPGNLTMCYIPGIVDDPRVINAIANSTLSLYKLPSTRVIVEAQWRKVAVTARYLTLWSAVYMITFMIINYVLISNQQKSAIKAVSLVGMAMWLFEFALRSVIAIGSISYGMKSEVGDVVEFIEVMLSGFCLACVFASEGGIKENPVFNAAIGVTVLFRWIKVLWSLTSTRTVGLRVLPIFIAMQQMGAFCGVLLTFLLATTNMYFALNHQPHLDDCFMIIFRMVLIGDWSLEEVMADNSFGSIQDNKIVPDEPRRTFKYWVVRVFVCFVVFFMGTAMMNIFIAVLSRFFDDAEQDKLSLFLRRRTRITQKHQLVQNWLTDVFNKILRRKLRGNSNGQRDESAASMTYLWCFTPTGNVDVEETSESATMDHRIEKTLEVLKQRTSTLSPSRKPTLSSSVSQGSQSSASVNARVSEKASDRSVSFSMQGKQTAVSANLTL